MYTAKIDASVNNVPTTFGTGSGSLIISSSPSGGEIFFINTTDSIVYATWGKFNTGATAPDSTLPGQCMAVPPAPTGGVGFAIFTAPISKGDTVFVRTDSASARTSGLVVASIL